MIAISGDILTENAGATSRSIRFSPLKMFPSYRYCTGKPWITSSPPGNVSDDLHVERRRAERQAERRVGVERVPARLACAMPVRLGDSRTRRNLQRRRAASNLTAPQARDRRRGRRGRTAATAAAGPPPATAGRQRARASSTLEAVELHLLDS